jgi:Tfp pilus tip-associated adhesin PilY1
MVRDAHGQLYRVTMRGSCPDPWGRRDGDDANEPEPLATPVTPEGAR